MYKFARSAFAAVAFLTLIENAKPSAIDISSLIEESQLIVCGKISKIRCYTDDRKRLITSAEISVTETWKGRLNDKIINVIQPGGVLGSIMQKNKNQKLFKRGDKAALFLVKNKKNNWIIVSLWQGHFDIKKSLSKPTDGIEIASNNGFAQLNANGMTLPLKDLKGLVQKEVQSK